MGFWSRLLGINPVDPAQRVLPEPYEAFISTAGIPVMDPGSPLDYFTNADPMHLWRTQPHVRKVVDFIARNVASVPLRAFERASDTERLRLTDHPLADVVGAPSPSVSPFRFWHSVISDGLLYDRWVCMKEYDESGRLRLVRIPAWQVRLVPDSLGRVKAAKFLHKGDSTAEDAVVDLDLGSLVYDYGYAPASLGLSPMVTLSALLREYEGSVEYRQDVWKNGARVPAYVRRPETAEPWADGQRDRFINMLRTYRAGEAGAGGWPMMEDGMEIRPLAGLTSSDANDLAGRELTAIEVASAFHIAPELVGARQGNYSNVREYRQMLYRDSLGPHIAAWEGALNALLVPDLAGGRPLYVEAHVEAKLRGSFEEQAAVKSSAIGAPWMTINEGRALENRPPIEGGDDLVTPLNVIKGGQASPRDTGSQNVNPEKAKAAPAPARKERPQRHEAKALEVLVAFFERQGRVVASAAGAGEDWWDEERWDRELSDDLLRLSLLTSETAARAALEGAGLDPDAYDVDRTLAYLRKAADSNAAGINGLTRDRVEDALSAGSPIGEVFEEATGQRAESAALSLTSFAAGFGSVESARQSSSGATKTWRVTSGNPRSSHAAMDGETVPVDELFSNGLMWPGAIGDPDEVAGCMCELDINY